MRCISSNTDQFEIKMLVFWNMMLFSFLDKYKLSEKTSDSIFRVEGLRSYLRKYCSCIAYNRKIYLFFAYYSTSLCSE
jgi:hypothetical protein